ncbi:uncharacterized protein LOC129761181 [Toxorhynchites rutilus septentrionalis]|uniref:uncharacterized protein LOC129761181 n=1 Tax=Toxorhynchites rutilus septentrionalis TaxID=329112 RepID=UPI002479FE40|nr:uncharacterized protein LOC129761181 [Toxorhynchites rutilus septentrionalis]
MLSTCDYDALVLTETWLRADISDCELSSEYQFFRCDRNPVTSQFSRGGGVLIAVKSNYSCAVVPLEDCGHLEQVAVRISLLYRTLYITAIYLRPLSSPALYTSHTNALQTIMDGCSSKDVILALGDYILPPLSWVIDENMNGYLPSNASTEQELALTEPMLSLGLTQVNSLPNSNGRLLDLAFISEPDIANLLEPAVPLLAADEHHKPFVLNMDALYSPANFSDYASLPPELNFRLCNFDSLNNILSSIDWLQLLEGGSVEVIADRFYDKLYEVLYAQVPLKRRVVKPIPTQPWWTSDLRNFRNVLRKARKRYLSTRSTEDKNSLRLTETNYNALLRSRYGEYIQRTQANLKRNPSAFWNYVKSHRSGNRIPDTMEFDGITASSAISGDVANLFASFFQTVYNSTSPPLHGASFDRIQEHNLNMPTFNFSPDEVLKALRDLDASKGPGVDGIPPSLLKHCAHSLAFPVSCIFNRSLRERIFPTVWKKASIVPIHKAGNRNHVKNYRGISLLCCFSKVFEKLVHNALYNVVHPLISEFQHGFVQHRSTTTNLLCYTNILFREVEARRQVDSIYVDFSKVCM